MILSRSTYRWFWPFWLPLGVLVAVAAGLGLGRKSDPPPADDPYGFAFTHLNLRMSQKALFLLRLKRAEALEKQVLATTSWAWVAGQLEVPERTYPVKIRLKGDFTDHLQGEKWSFRVKFDQGQAWKGVRAFSLQSPATRGFLKEWMFHQVLQEEGFLTPRYDFVRVSLNGTDWGIYALEEHFGKEMIERSGRREGPILKLDESGYWATRTEAFRAGSRFSTDYPVYDAMTITPFQPRKALSSPDLKTQLGVGQNLFHSWKYGLLPPGSNFNTEQMARFLALVDVHRAYHCLFSHNVRMYYNPVISKLEPVAYDGYDGINPIVYQYEPYLGYRRDESTSLGSDWDGLWMQFLGDSTFVAAYERNLMELTREGRWEAYWATEEKALRQREAFLRQEFFNASLDREYFEAEAAEIRESLGTSSGISF